MKNNFAGDKELCICFVEDGVASISSSINKYSNKIKKLAATYFDVTTLIENEDGSVYMQFPSEWIKLPKPKRVVSDKNKQMAAERMKAARQKKGQI